MKKQIFFTTMLLVTFFVTQALAITFPTPDPDTQVSSPGDGVVVVKANGNSGWVMTQFCQDNLRAGCGNNVIVKPSELSGDGNTMTFKIDKAGISDGQVAFNFRDSSGKWLLIPDCRVKTGSNIGLGMSFQTADIAESGGAHFVYTGSGIPVWHPVKAGACNDDKAAAARTAAVAAEKAATAVNNGADQGAVAVATNQSAAAAHNSAAATNQSAAANNSSQANATSFLNINQVNDGKGKGKKGGNTAIIYAPNAKQDVQNNNIKGNSADVKVYLNKSGKGNGNGIKNVITYVGPSFQTIHIGVKGVGSETDVYSCSKCHSDVAKDDARMKALVFKSMSCAASGACTDKDHKATKAKKSAPAKKPLSKDTGS